MLNSRATFLFSNLCSWFFFASLRKGALILSYRIRLSSAELVYKYFGNATIEVFDGESFIRVLLREFMRLKIILEGEYVFGMQMIY